MKLKAFHGFEGLTEKEKSEICNGAGAAGDWRSAFIPNSMWGLSLREAFDRHDYAYHIGKTAVDKEDADMHFLCNCVTIILAARSNVFVTYARMARAIKYYLAVHYKGADAFYAS
ncbi:hypothetical protein KAU11_08095 [Candidatus Babeliales bacterium]|nr:hypothetical protein [Candidatus Babeliales bacterium]